MYIPKKARCLAIAFLLYLNTQPLLGKSYGAYSFGLSNFSFAPIAKEKTVNYYGVMGGLHLGYKFGKSFGMGIFGRYTPGHTKLLHTLEDATLLFYGVEFLNIVKKVVYFNIKGGLARYRLLHSPTDENEINGEWQGSMSSFEFGAITNKNKKNIWQIGLQVTTIKKAEYQVQEEQTTPTLTTRDLSQFALVFKLEFADFFKRAF